MTRIARIASNVGVMLTPRVCQRAPEVVSTIIYSNGDSYVGEVDGNGLKSGRGIMKWENGDVYDGEFKDDLPNGKGKYTWTSGNVYDGEFKDGLSHGKGKFTLADGSVFVGEFKDDLPNGKGKITLSDDSVYEGDIKHAKMHGKGKLTCRNNSVYDGDFKDNNRHGKGKLTFPDNSVYEGEFKDGMMHKGKFTFADDSVYEGEFKDGMMHKGKFTFADDSVYEGEFKDGMMHKGKFTLADGSVYDGEFKDGAANGKGKLTYTDDTAYDGEFKDGNWHGKGKLTSADGSVVYDGEFKDGKKHGKGKLTNVDGSVYDGEFKDGKKHNKGKLTSADGSVVYDGMWFEDERDQFGLQTRSANANGGGVDVVFTLYQDHIQCGICYNAFTDQTSRELLPVLGACGHYFCHGCIVRCRFMVGSNGTVGCPKCRKADQFMPGNPVPHRMLINLLRARDEFGLQTRCTNANGGGVDVVFTLDQDHIQCGICHDAFTADMASTDLPVLGACGHYFCHGCIVRCRFMVGSNGTVGCPKCRKADQFMPGNPVPHRMLIDLLRSARPIVS